MSKFDHGNLPGHSLASLTTTMLEKVIINNLQYRKEQETYHGDFGT